MRAWCLLGLLAVGCGGSTLPPGEHEITRPGELLARDGHLREPGWARRQQLTWNRDAVADPMRLREWDFVAWQSATAAVNVTLLNLGFVQLGTLTVVELPGAVKHETSVVRLSQDDPFQLSSALEGSAWLQLAGEPERSVAITSTSTQTDVSLAITTPLSGPPARGAVSLARRATMEYLSLATPFVGDPSQFFFEQKVPGLAATGSIAIDGKTFEFTDAPAIIDWGRGVWPSQATWRWAAGQVTLGDGRAVAFNLGEGFGDDQRGSENLFVIGDRAQKLGRVAWTFDPTRRDRAWTFADGEGRLTLTLTPSGEEGGGLDFGERYSRLAKIYGTWSGQFRLEDGSTIFLDGAIGFAEEMQLSW